MLTLVLQVLRERFHVHTIDETTEDRRSHFGPRAWIHRRFFLRDAEGRGPSPARVATAEIVIPTESARLNLRVDPNDDETLHVSVAIPFVVATYFSVRTALVDRVAKAVLPKDQRWRSGREVSLAIHDWRVWWSLWMSPDGSDSNEPRYRRGNLAVLWPLGKQTYASVPDGDPVEVQIPMPEGNVPALVKWSKVTRGYKRWPWTTTKRRAEIDPIVPVPIPGKGENSWDCGRDAIYGMHLAEGAHRGTEEAIGEFIASTLRLRREREGSWLAGVPAAPPPTYATAERAALVTLAAFARTAPGSLPHDVEKACELARSYGESP